MYKFVCGKSLSLDLKTNLYSSGPKNVHMFGKTLPKRANQTHIFFVKEINYNILDEIQGNGE